MNFLINNLAFLFDVRVEPFSTTNTIGIVAGIGFFLILAGVGIVAFFMVKKTVKMAIRMAIVGAILLIAIVGAISFWMFTSDTKPAARPTNTRNR
jgi:H+/Cl- antiporter ClcA